MDQVAAPLVGFSIRIADRTRRRPGAKPRRRAADASAWQRVFLERPFHPTTLVSVVRTALRGRLRQYEARARLEALRESEAHARGAEASLRRLNETLEARVQERTAELAATNRQLVAQIEERERVELTLRQMQRLEAIGQLTSGVAHDFNNLLTVVLGNIGFMEKSIDRDTKLKQRLSHMRLAAERGAKLTSQLLAFSRRQRLEPSRSTQQGAGEYARSAAKHAGRRHRHQHDIRGGLWPALADPTQIELVVLNLVINARDAMQDRGSVTIETANAKIGPPEKAGRASSRRLRHDCRDRHGLGHDRGSPCKSLRAFFHDQRNRQGVRTGIEPGLGIRKAIGRRNADRDARRRRNIGEDLFATRAGRFRLAIVGPAGRRRAIRTKTATIMVVDDDSTVRDVTASILEDDLGYIRGASRQRWRGSRSSRSAPEGRSHIAGRGDARHERRGSRAPGSIEISRNPDLVRDRICRQKHSWRCRDDRIVKKTIYWRRTRGEGQRSPHPG